MSTVGSEADANMARSASFVGTLKRLFKSSHRNEEGARVGVASPAFESSLRPAVCSVLATDRGSFDSQISQTSRGGTNEMLASPFSSRKSVDIQLLASNSGPLLTGTTRSVSVAQAPLHHSISDTCENPSLHISLQRAPADDGGNGGWTFDRHKHPAGSPGRNSSSSHLRGATLKSAARSDASLPSLYDAAPIRSASLDLPVGGSSFTTHPVRDPAGRQVLPVTLSSAEAPAYGRVLASQLSLPCAANPAAADAPPAEPAAPPPNSLLLALCPGVPSAMRRRHWSLQDFEIVRRVYKSLTSAVYRATCRCSGLPVALKVYSLLRVPPNVIHMIVREIKIHVDLVHRNIVMLYAAFQEEKRLVLVQEYAGRGDLYGISRSLNRRMTEAQLTHLVLAPFTEALSYLHARGICHRDIKPENILFTHDWRLLVADFGVSIDLHQERAVTRAGTLEYMAPEVERCPLKMTPEENKDNTDLSYTTAVDIWAVGVLSYELLVGFPPFVVDHPPAGGGGGGGGGPRESFLAEYATRRTLSFPASISPHAHDFIRLALAERPEERPTALQLARHPWLAAAMQQPQPRRSSGQFNSPSVTSVYPSRLGSTSFASVPGSAFVV